jgi:hypothetical protein
MRNKSPEREATTFMTNAQRRHRLMQVQRLKQHVKNCCQMIPLFPSLEQDRNPDRFESNSVLEIHIYLVNVSVEQKLDRLGLTND